MRGVDKMRDRPSIVKRLSPKARIALRAVSQGMKHREAAALAGIHHAYVSQLKESDPGREYMERISQQMDDGLVDMSSLLSSYGREAVNRLAGLMRFSANEQIVLRSAMDLADRAPATQKIQKHQVETFSISGKDAKEIAAAMVEAARLKDEYNAAATGDYIKIPMETGYGSQLDPTE